MNSARKKTNPVNEKSPIENLPGDLFVHAAKFLYPVEKKSTGETSKTMAQQINKSRMISIVQDLRDLVELLNLQNIAIPFDRNAAFATYQTLLTNHRNLIQQMIQSALDQNASCNPQLERLIKHMCQADYHGSGALLLKAVTGNNFGVAAIFIKMGANVHFADPETGDTSLHVAVDARHRFVTDNRSQISSVDLAVMLIRAGAKADRKNKQQTSAWEQVSMLNRDIKQMRAFLAEQKDLVDLKNDFGSTALLTSLQHKVVGGVELLLSHSANPKLGNKMWNSVTWCKAGRTKTTYQVLDEKNRVTKTIVKESKSKNEDVIQLHANMHDKKNKYFKLISEISRGPDFDLRLIQGLIKDFVSTVNTGLAAKLFNKNKMSQENIQVINGWINRLPKLIKVRSLQDCLKDLEDNIEPGFLGDLKERILFVKLYVPQLAGTRNIEKDIFEGMSFGAGSDPKNQGAKIRSKL